MGMFGSQAGYAGPSGWADKLALIGATLKDVSSPDGNSIGQVQQMLAARQQQAQKQAFLQQLGGMLPDGSQEPASGGGGLIGGQAAAGGAAPTPAAGGLSINDPRMAKIALQAQALGIPISSMIEVLKAQQPNVNYDRGFGYDQKTGSAVGGFHPELDKGQEPVFDASGRVIGLRNMLGATQAAAQMTDATEAAKARYNPVQATDAQGRPITTTALSIAGGGPIVGQSPADRETAVGNATTAVERAKGQPQAFNGLQDQARTSDFVIDSINKVLPKIGPMTTGFAANLSPIKGTSAHDLQAALDTIRANVGFDKLQSMRQSSPTGGALGNVSEQENRLLQSVLGSLDQGQSPDQLKASLTKVRDQLMQIRGQRQQLYNSQYPNGRPAQSAAPSRDAIIAEMRRRGLRP